MFRQQPSLHQTNNNLNTIPLALLGLSSDCGGGCGFDKSIRSRTYDHSFIQKPTVTLYLNANNMECLTLSNNLPVCVCVCVSVTLSVNSPTGQTPQRIFFSVNNPVGYEVSASTQSVSMYSRWRYLANVRIT